MTWTVTALGRGGSSTTMTTPVTTLALSSISAAAGSAVAIFVQYTDFSADAITATDSASNTGWVRADTAVDAGTGQGIASLYNLSLGSSITSITANFGSATVQSFTALKFTNSVAGTPTLDGHSINDNSTSSTTPNSGTASATNGDLVLTGLVSNGPGGLGGSISLAITGATGAVGNSDNTTTGSADGSGVTTTTGNVTSTWTVQSTPHVVAQLIFSPPASDTLMPQICFMEFERDEKSPILQRRLSVRRSPGEPWHPRRHGPTNGI